MEQAILLLMVSVAALGVAAQWIGWRLRIPSILILLAIGLLIGPITGWVKPSHVLGAALSPAIGMTVAVIVFEGGLNLNLRELHTAGSGVTRLVLLALPLNWLFGALAAHFAGRLSWEVSVLVGAILVVTGPTVIMPLLRQAKLDSRAASILKWEAIVNDPIGATLTLAFLSFLLLLHGQSETAPALIALAGRALAGCLAAGALGVALPHALRFAFHHDLAPEYLKTPILLAGALAVYAVGESIQPETGLVGATVFGVVLANIEVTGLQELRRFKESLTVFLVSGLFILLTANIDRAAIARISWPVLFTAGAILFIVRPAAIGFATIGARMSVKERLLIGWIGPRGVVAAAVAGLAGQQLQSAGYPGADMVLPIVFCVIASTVVLHGLSLAPLARLLKLASDAPPGLLIIGASPWTVALAQALGPLGVPAMITDPSFEALKRAKRAGLPHARVEILSAVGERLVDLRDFEYLLAATDDDAYNSLVCTRFAPELGRERVHQPPPAGQREQLQTLREWRGKYVPHATLSHARLSELIGDGFGFRLHPADRAPGADDAEHWPVVARAANGALRFFSPDSEVTPLEDEQVLWFEKTPPAAPERQPRRWRLPTNRGRIRSAHHPNRLSKGRIAAPDRPASRHLLSTTKRPRRRRSRAECGQLPDGGIGGGLHGLQRLGLVFQLQGETSRPKAWPELFSSWADCRGAMRTLSELTLSRFVQAVGEDRPSPRCGGAAAVSLALAAACARKAFSISARHQGGETTLEAAAERCRILSEAAIVGVQRDATNFEALLKAPRGTDEPALALEGDAQVLIALATELRELVERHAPAIDPHLAGDAAAALALADAFERIQTRNLLEI